MRIVMIFEAQVSDSEDLAGLREQVAMRLEELADVRCVKVQAVRGTGPCKSARGRYGNVMLTDDEFDALWAKFGDRAGELIDDLSYKLHQKGYRFKDHFAVIMEWSKEEEHADRRFPQMDGRAASFDVDEFFKANLERGIGK